MIQNIELSFISVSVSINPFQSLKSKSQLGVLYDLNTSLHNYVVWHILSHTMFVQQIQVSQLGMLYDLNTSLHN